MKNTRLRFAIARDTFNPFGGYGIRIGTRINESVPWAVAESIQFRVLESDAVEVAPCLTVSRDDLQALMDELWNVGIRPTEGTGSAGSLAATERHLADMRAFAAKALNTELK